MRSARLQGAPSAAEHVTFSAFVRTLIQHKNTRRIKHALLSSTLSIKLHSRPPRTSWKTMSAGF
jgi:hypothetical protein